MTDLSIVVVSYNTIALTRDCLASVYKSLGSLQAEVLVVDNASTDGSPEMVEREFPDATLMRNDRNLGFAAANNQAIRTAMGKFILLLNSDTRVLGSVIRESVEYLEKHPEVGVMGCRTLNGDGTVQLTCSQEPTLLNILLLVTGLWKFDRPQWLGRYQMQHWKRDSEREVDVVSGSYMLVRRSALEEVGLLDEAFFFFGEETDWCRRFREAGWKVMFAPVGEIIHYGSASALSLGHRRDVYLTSGLVRYQRKHGGLINAVTAWVLLFGFNLSRCLFWSIAAAVHPNEKAFLRRNHFWNVARTFGETWPRTDKRPAQ